jgi:hypothetical protein
MGGTEFLPLECTNSLLQIQYSSFGINGFEIAAELLSHYPNPSRISPRFVDSHFNSPIGGTHAETTKNVPMEYTFLVSLFFRVPDLLSYWKRGKHFVGRYASRH